MRFLPLHLTALLLALLAPGVACADDGTSGDATQDELFSGARSTTQLADAIPLGPVDLATQAPAEGVVPTMALFAAPSESGGGGDQWQFLPQGLIYRTYLAGVKESRMGGVWNYDNVDGRKLDVNLGGHAPILRYGSLSGTRPTGWQIGMEGSGQVRLDRDEHSDVEAADFRFGVPITWGDAIHQTKFAFYHLSSHIGDEYLLKHPAFDRLNYSQNVFVYGHSLYPVPDWRVYGEVGYGIVVDVAKQWQFQFGAEWAPELPTGFRGAPFLAINGYLREELNYGGNFVAQTGWAWRSSEASGLFRLGAQYYNGKNEQFSLFNSFEQKYGLGIWYDY